MQEQRAQEKKEPRKQGEWEAEEEQEEEEQERESLGNEAQEQTEQECRWAERAQALQGKQGEKGQLGAGLRPCLTPLEALEALQRELIPLNDQASREHSRLKLRIDLRRRYHLEKRSALIQGIPGFWAKAVSFMLVKEGLQRAGLVQWDGKGRWYFSWDTRHRWRKGPLLWPAAWRGEHMLRSWLWIVCQGRGGPGCWRQTHFPSHVALKHC